MNSFLDDIPAIDWHNLDAAYSATSMILERLAADKPTLRALVERAGTDPAIFAKCEEHALDDKIVLYDDLERGFRIRLRLSTSNQYERAHTHRFTFTTLVMRGMYYQNWYESDKPFDDGVSLDDLRTICTREDGPGTCFTISHDAIHSTVTAPDTISLLMRGPAMKDKALIINTETGHSWYRVGEKDETAARRVEKQMSRTRYQEWVNKLTGYGLI